METSQDVSFLSALLPFSGIIFLIILGVLLLNQQFNKKLFRQKLDKEKLKARHQLELLQTSIAIQEEERKRIARDLHDELGAALSMTRMRLVQLEQQNAADAVLASRLLAVRTLTELALATMRRISHELMPPQLENFGLIKTLESTVAEINNLDALRIELITPEGMFRLSHAVELALYRVCMELINNTIRHAGASQICIEIKKDPHLLYIEYRDNGKGLHGGVPKKGIGLHSIETRIHSIDGVLSIRNNLINGFEARIELPLTISN